MPTCKWALTNITLHKTHFYITMLDNALSYLGCVFLSAKEDGQVDGLIPHLVEGGVSIL
jgi:hypothetical protein